MGVRARVEDTLARRTPSRYAYILRDCSNLSARLYRKTHKFGEVGVHWESCIRHIMLQYALDDVAVHDGSVLAHVESDGQSESEGESVEEMRMRIST